MSMDAWMPSRKKDCELVVFGDGGGYLRLFELRINTVVGGGGVGGAAGGVWGRWGIPAPL